MSVLWNQVLDALEEHIPAEQVEEWLRPTKVLKNGQNSLHLVVPNDLYIDWINENYLDNIQTVLKQIGHPQLDIAFHTQDSVPHGEPKATR